MSGRMTIKASCLLCWGCFNVTVCVFGSRWGSWRVLTNTWVWKEPEEVRICWWVTPNLSEHLKVHLQSLNTEKTPFVSLNCEILQPHYATCCFTPLQTAAQLDRGTSPITLLSRDENKNLKMWENEIRKWEDVQLSLSLPAPRSWGEQVSCSCWLTAGHCYASSCCSFPELRRLPVRS